METNKRYVHKPYYVDFSVTPFCNLSCSFCSAGAAGKSIGTENTTVFSLEKIEDIFNQFDQNEILRVSLEGGEPFTRSDMIEIMRMADKHNFLYYVNTNATLITEQIAAEISQTKVDKICISIDGPEKIHDMSRGIPGTFKKMKRAVSYLLKYNISIDGIITLTKVNKDYLFETFEIINSLGIKNVAIMLLAPVGTALDNKEKVAISYDEWSKLLIKMTDLKQSGKIPVNVNIVPTGEALYPWELFLPLKECGREDDLYLWKDSTSYTRLTDTEFGCTAGKDNLAIDGYGNVFGCSLMLSEKKLIAGNIYKQSLYDIWNNSKLFKKMRELKISNITGECKKCQYLNICKAGCRACAFSITSKLNGSDEYCPLCRKEI